MVQYMQSVLTSVANFNEDSCNSLIFSTKNGAKLIEVA